MNPILQSLAQNAEAKQVVLCLIIPFLTAGLSAFLYFAMQDGMILAFYRKRLDGWEARSKIVAFLAKPLGLCIYCTNFWVHGLFCLLFCPDPILFASVGLSHVCLLQFMKL